MTENERYYIDKKQYIPDESDVLCTVSHGDAWEILKSTERSVLYRTKKGAYFLVHSYECGVEVCVMDEAAAFDFMDRNAAGIDTGTYNRLFGEPERG